GYVTKQNPSASSMREAESSVTIYVSTGAPDTGSNSGVLETNAVIETESTTTPTTSAETTATTESTTETSVTATTTATTETTATQATPTPSPTPTSTPMTSPTPSPIPVIYDISVNSTGYGASVVGGNHGWSPGNGGDSLSRPSISLEDGMIKYSFTASSIDYLVYDNRNTTPDDTYYVKVSIYYPQYGDFYYYTETNVTSASSAIISSGSYDAKYGPNCVMIELFINDDDWQGRRFSEVIYYYPND
ncbi:MAG: hypothetical protein IKQ81_04445, partial [Clostridiales bacterium]|nr:hypothetical protein [Clostridiales bacterium]